MSVSRTVIKGLITAAVAAGVPLFNSGNALGCAVVYESTLRQLGACGLTAEAAEANKAKRELQGDPEKLAWAYRRQLDGILMQGGRGRGGAAGIGAASAAASAVSIGSPFLVADFTRTSGPFAQPSTWTSVNDNVMGGRSDASFRSHLVEGKSVVFSGTLRVEGGGFASVRAQLDRPLDAEALGLDAVEIEASLPEEEEGGDTPLPRVYRVGGCRVVSGGRLSIKLTAAALRLPLNQRKASSAETERGVGALPPTLPSSRSRARSRRPIRCR